MVSLALLSVISLMTCLMGAARAINYPVLNVLRRRDSSPPPPLVTVDIPLTVSNDQRYIVGVNMSSLNTQIFKFALVANTGYSAVAGITCDDCGNVTAYNASLSTTQKPLTGSKNITIGPGSLIGSLIKEDCGLHEVNGSSWLYKNQTIIVANSSSLFSGVTSGLIGLGTNANGANGDFLDTIFGGWFTRNPTHNNFSFGMALQPPTFTSDDDNGNGGILHWVVPDSSAYEGEIAWNDANVAGTAPDTVAGMALDNSYALPESDWTIECEGWVASMGSSAVSNSSKNQVIVEPYFSSINFPLNQANALYGSIANAVKLNSLVNGAQVWSIPCDTQLTVTFTFAGQSFSIGENQLIVKQSDGSCVGTVQAWSDGSVNSILLGSSFISAFYLIFVVGQPGSGVPNSIGIANRSSHSSKPIGAIVGGAVGGVAVLIVVLVIAYMLGRRRGKSQVFIVSNARRNSHEKTPEAGQYTYANLSGRTGHNDTSSPPGSAFSATSSHPLLPDSARSPVMNVLESIYSPTTVPSETSPILVPLTATSVGDGAVSHHISYNNSAVGSNISSAQFLFAPDDRNYSIQPYMLPSPSPLCSAQSGLRSEYKTRQSQSPQPAQLPSSQSTQPSILDSDTSPSFLAESAVQPFILAAAPRGPRKAATSKATTAATARAFTMEEPAPPYSTMASISPTLVEYAPSLNTSDDPRRPSSRGNS